MSTETSARPSAPILVVDYDLRTRDAIRQTLEDEGFEVETAADGGQALQQARRRPPALVVLDTRLPVAEGTAIAGGLRDILGAPPPILLITADDRGELKARHIGAYAFLPKPFDLDDLLALVRVALP
jgi:DNA-binding response OmpR family regulator